jgi:hypothetical protein
MMFVFYELLRNWESQKLKDLNSTITVNLFILLPRNNSCQEDHVFFVHTVWTSLTHIVWVLCMCVCLCGESEKAFGVFYSTVQRTSCTQDFIFCSCWSFIMNFGVSKLHLPKGMGGF